MSQTWLILGATSTIARAFARLAAADGCALLLAGRDRVELDRLAADCFQRGARHAEAALFDARDASGYADLITRLTDHEGILNIASFVGSMPDQTAIDADPALIHGVMMDNFTGPATLFTMALPQIEARGAGTLIGVGSVAGDRGRLGNYVYGAAKAAFATYLSGLRNSAARGNVHVMTVKPGPVDTAMTWGMRMPFMASPERVAEDIYDGVVKERDVVYTAPIWRVIMTVIRIIPEPIFKKMTF